MPDPIVFFAIGGFVLLNLVTLSFPCVVLDWHRRINSWPECVIMMNGSIVDRDLNPSWRTSAEARAMALCETEPIPVLLRYPPEPEWLNYASADSTNREVATWIGNFVAHVDPAESDGEHAAFVSPPDITRATVATIVIVIADIVAGVAAFLFFN